MICSPLNPLSVMHLYAKDLDDLRSLVTSRGSDMHAHICVDAQTGLGTIPPRPESANIGTATTVSHRVEKRRILESFIMCQPNLQVQMISVQVLPRGKR